MNESAQTNPSPSAANAAIMVKFLILQKCIYAYRLDALTWFHTRSSFLVHSGRKSRSIPEAPCLQFAPRQTTCRVPHKWTKSKARSDVVYGRKLHNYKRRQSQLMLVTSCALCNHFACRRTTFVLPPTHGLHPSGHPTLLRSKVETSFFLFAPSLQGIKGLVYA